MKATALEVAALVGSRICHDLSSPLGAISNGVELLGLTGQTGGAELALIADSAGGAADRVRFLRVVFGAGGPDQRYAPTEISAVLAAQFDPERWQIDWAVDGPVPRDWLRLVFLLLLCAEQAAPRGTVTVTASGARWMIHLTSDRIIPDPRLWAHLTGGGEAIPAAGQIQFLLAPMTADALGARITVDMSDTRLVITFGD